MSGSQSCSEKYQIHFFSLLPWAAQLPRQKNSMFQIVAYRLTAYRTGFFPFFLKARNICSKWISLNVVHTIIWNVEKPFIWMLSDGKPLKSNQSPSHREVPRWGVSNITGLKWKCFLVYMFFFSFFWIFEQKNNFFNFTLW